MTHRSDNASQRHANLRRSLSLPAPEVCGPQAQFARLRENLLGGFGRGASTEQVQAHTRDRPAANPPPPPFEQALEPVDDRRNAHPAAAEEPPHPPPTVYFATGFLSGVLLTFLLLRRRPTRR